jgi:hypothetical protein
MATIELVNGRGTVLLDEVDLEWASGFRWRLHTHGYAQRSTGELLHRAIAERMGLDIDGVDVDHENGVKLDCRRENLRRAADGQNQYNRRMDRRNTSGVKGVYWSKQHKAWLARVNAGGKTHFVGLFKDLDQARKATEAKRVELHGDFACNG